MSVFYFGGFYYYHDDDYDYYSHYSYHNSNANILPQPYCGHNCDHSNNNDSFDSNGTKF